MDLRSANQMPAAAATDLRLFAPLPDEILHLSESETACQYCGISYLLLSKYERMLEHVRGLEKHLSGLQEYAKERPKMLEDLNLLRMSAGELQGKTKVLEGELARTRQQARDSSTELEALRQKYESASLDLRAASQRHQAEKDYNRTYVNRLVGLLTDIRSELLQHKRGVVEAKAELRDSYSKLIRDTIPAVQHIISEQVSQYVNRQRAEVEQRLHRESEKERDSLTEQLRSAKEQLDIANERISKLQHDLQQHKMESEEHVIAQKNYAQGLQSTCLKLDDQLHAARTMFTNLTHERDKLAVRHRNLEMRIIEERQAKHQNSAGLRDQIALLEAKLEQKTKELSDISERQQSERRNSQDGVNALANANRALAQKDEQIHSLERGIRELHGATQSMRLDRQRTIEAHQSRIKQLQDKFLEEITIAGKLEADKREAELRRIFAVDKDDALQFQRDTITMEMNSRIDELNRQVEALKQAKDQTDMRALRQVRSVEETWERKHAVAIEQLNKLIASNAADFAHYQARIRALEEQLAQASTTQRVSSAGPPVDPAQIAELKSLLTKREAEIGFLKDTVRLECEERMGLVAELDLIKRRTPAPATLSRNPSRNGGIQQSDSTSASPVSRTSSTKSMPQIPPAREPLEPGEQTFHNLMKAAAAKKNKMLSARSNMELNTKGGMGLPRSSSTRSSWSTGSGRFK
ncbi:uncharacterized protein EV422DRAFT_510971 [Fimicolochytrium jonesii]|uniref:uncharacterized protein n=1 Tax=Fimicolochytrium jonesii TaxID=1396493 RepID=UPI0022FEB0DD|nr:uncharacterized protein EV422DRAFT_510971 [Fimicolochytrium jonesii]KAI8826651.1 hypothetical protein EV422DRAFT_510971 [Fimicolochytrium jonesii]